MDTPNPHPHPIEHPPYEIAPPEDTMGLRHVRVALADLNFPASKRDLLARAGNWRIPVTGNHFHTLAEFLEEVPDARFRSEDDVVRAIAKGRPELRERRQRRGGTA